jgi:hypothetical protein
MCAALSKTSEKISYRRQITNRARIPVTVSDTAPAHQDVRAGSRTAPHLLAGLKLLKSTDFMGEHAFLSDPDVNGVLGDAEMDSDIVS